MTPRPRRSSSPDPLATPLDLEECIYVPPPPLPPKSTIKRARPTTPKSGPSTPTPRKARPVVQLVSYRKRRKDEDSMMMGILGEDDLPEMPSPNKAVKKKQNGAAVSPRTKSDVKGKGKAIAEVHSTPEKSKTISTTTPARSARKTLASSLKPLPTPSPVRPRSTPRNSSVRNFDEAFTSSGSIRDPFGPSDDVFGDTGNGTSPSISRDVFLANEALRRQREARNFRYEGDVDAPKLTRSGRVVRADKVDGMDGREGGDEYGPEEGEQVGVNGDQGALLDETVLDTLNDIMPRSTADADDISESKLESNAKPLTPGARRHILNILSTLTGQNVGRNPPPFPDEETNEALQGLVNLLKGTVERGEGNSALLVGPRGTGKTRTMARALNLLSSTSKTAPIIVRLSGHAQINDRLAIREMGRQIAEAEGKAVSEEKEEEDADGDGDEQEEYAPTTLPSHLLALLTAPSPRAIIIIMEEFDLFTEHARQALLYCLLDVVQSVKTGPVESTGRGVAVIGLTSRIDTLLLLEKRVKSRFSHRVWRIASPLSPGGPGWKPLLKSILLPWLQTDSVAIKQTKKKAVNGIVDKEERWKLDWTYAVEFMLDDAKVKRYLDRLTGLTTDIRNLFRPFIIPISQIASGQADFLSVTTLTRSILSQIENSGWGLGLSKLRGLSQPCLAVLVIAKHLFYAGREEFNFAQVEEEYLRFGRTRLVGSGRVRWPIGVLRVAYDHLLHLGLLVPLGHSSLNPQFTRVRCTLSPHEIVGWFKGEGANSLGTELGNWGRMMGGHA